MVVMRRTLLAHVIGCALFVLTPHSSFAQTATDVPGQHCLHHFYGPDRPNPAAAGQIDLLNLFALRMRPVVGGYGWLTPDVQSPWFARVAVLPVQRRQMH